MVSQIVSQIIQGTDWGDLDYLFVDMCVALFVLQHVSLQSLAFLRCAPCFTAFAALCFVFRCAKGRQAQGTSTSQFARILNSTAQWL